MIPARAARTTLPRVAARSARASLRQARFQSSTSSSSSNASSPGSHLASGLAGGVGGALLLYGIYTFTPSGRMSSTINKAASEANKKYKAASQKLQASTPDTDTAIDYIKNYLYTYAGWVPGGKEYVDRAFKDVDTVRENHRDEFNEIISDAYKQFQQVSKAGLSLEAASKAAEVLADVGKKLADLAGDALGDVVDNHPDIKKKFGGSIDQLKQMGEQYGPEAKKEVEKTWSQVKDVLAGGLSVANVDKARKVLEDKVEKIKKLGDEAWQKGLEQAKPLLDKKPELKKLVEENADALKQGNAGELFEKVKKAADSGDLGDLRGYIDKTVETAKSKGKEYAGAVGGGMDKYFDQIPSGSDILAKVKQLRDVAEKHKDEGEKLLKETMEEIKTVLEKKSEKAQEIAEKAKKEAK